jgi:hypothetical protein
MSHVTKESLAMRPDRVARSNECEIEIANYETGARKLAFSQKGSRDEEFDQKAAGNKRPSPYGLTEPIDETPGETRKSDGVDH